MKSLYLDLYDTCLLLCFLMRQRLNRIVVRITQNNQSENTNCIAWYIGDTHQMLTSLYFPLKAEVCKRCLNDLVTVLVMTEVKSFLGFFQAHVFGCWISVVFFAWPPCLPSDTVGEAPWASYALDAEFQSFVFCGLLVSLVTQLGRLPGQLVLSLSRDWGVRILAWGQDSGLRCAPHVCSSFTLPGTLIFMRPWWIHLTLGPGPPPPHTAKPTVVRWSFYAKN